MFALATTSRLSTLRAPTRTSLRMQSSAPECGLKEVLRAEIPKLQARIKAVKAAHGEKPIGTCTVAQAYTGMRDVTSMVYETSLLDAQEGIRFRGLSLPECREQLPRAPGSDEPLPESMLWLLLSGKVPTQKEAEALSRELMARATLPAHVAALLDNLPKTLHPMAQLVSAVAALSHESQFAQAYAEGAPKNKYWESAYEDSLNLIAALPLIASRIYRNLYRGGNHTAINRQLDWSANFTRMMGYEDAQFDELMRLYLTIHSDHEGGNVSAHTTHLVGSALSDPYLSFAAGMAGLAGPLHGLANQEVLKWLQELQATVGENPTDEQITEFITNWLASGRVVPGYGHAVLRKTDPRYTVQIEFAAKNMPDDPLYKLNAQLYRLIPPILGSKGKIKNPWPNVDCASGTLLQFYGLREENFYTVLFGVSRALGVLPALVWSRALGFAIERPKSVTTEWIENEFKNK